MNIINKAKGNWFISLLICCSIVAGATWSVEYVLYVQPRDHEIDYLKSRIDDYKSQPAITKQEQSDTIEILGKTAIRQSTSCSAKGILIKAQKVDSSSKEVELAISLPGQKPEILKGKEGDRLSAVRLNCIYYVDLLSIRGDIIDLSMEKYILPSPTPNK